MTLMQVLAFLLFFYLYYLFFWSARKDILQHDVDLRKLFLSTNGRLGRVDFIILSFMMDTLVRCLVNIPLAQSSLSTYTFNLWGIEDSLDGYVTKITLFCFVVFFTSKRLHDLGKSGKRFTFMAVLVFLTSLALKNSLNDPYNTSLWELSMTAMFLGVLFTFSAFSILYYSIITLLKSGETRLNRYGVPVSIFRSKKKTAS